MNANVLFWTGALVNLTLIGGLVVHGVRLARAGRVAQHRRTMLAAASLVAAFLVAYPVKLALLGREDLSRWSDLHLGILRFHETCVAVMLVAGAVAGYRAWSMRGTRRVTQSGDDPATPDATLGAHRRAGWVAAVGAALGLLSAFGILFGMIDRT